MTAPLDATSYAESSSSFVSMAGDEHKSGTQQMSCPTFRPKDLKAETMTYRQFFAARWRDFIRENFESPAHAAAVFRVTPTTAENWWQGFNAPQGWVVGKAVSDPDMGPRAMAHLSGNTKCERYAAE